MSARSLKFSSDINFGARTVQVEVFFLCVSPPQRVGDRTKKSANEIDRYGEVQRYTVIHLFVAVRIMKKVIKTINMSFIRLRVLELVTSLFSSHGSHSACA